MGHISKITPENLRRRAERAASHGPEDLQGQPLSSQTRGTFWEATEDQNPQAVIAAWLEHVVPSNGSSKG